jgi:uncharacterized protein (DUF1499 family)
MIAPGGILKGSAGMRGWDDPGDQEGYRMERMGFEWILAPILVVFLFSGCSGSRPPTLGVKDNRLSPCPASPNCVSSQSDDERHRIDAIRFPTPATEGLARLKEIVLGMERSTLVREGPDYLHVEVRTFLGFVDDLEFYADESQKLIHLRSASRVGYWDLGVNRRRVETVRAEFGKR